MSVLKSKMKGLKEYSLVLFVVILCVVCAFTSDKFFTPGNMENVLRNVTTNALISMGMLIVVITGGIDLSVAAIAGFAGVFVAGMLKDGMAAFPAIMLTLALCTAIGALTGFMINHMSIAPFIATLAVGSIVDGVKYIYCNSNTISITNGAFKVFGTGSFVNISNCIWYMFIIVIIMQVIMSKTSYGRSLYALGGNAAAAHLAGINISKIRFSVYMISAFCSAWAGIMMASRLGVGSPSTGLNYVNYGIASVVIGGGSLAGGRGKPAVVFFGAFVIAIINNFMTLMGIGSYYQKVVLGAIIIVAVFFSEYTNKKRR